MRSRVGPGGEQHALAGERAGGRDDAAGDVPASCVGSSMRPAPTSPQAWSPSPGPQMWTPRDLSVATLAWVAAFAHITRFMAGRERDRRGGGEAQSS